MTLSPLLPGNTGSQPVISGASNSGGNLLLVSQENRSFLLKASAYLDIKQPKIPVAPWPGNDIENELLKEAVYIWRAKFR